MYSAQHIEHRYAILAGILHKTYINISMLAALFLGCRVSHDVHTCVQINVGNRELPSLDPIDVKMGLAFFLFLDQR